jgi:hypothetical protein
MANNIIMLNRGETYVFDFVLHDPIYDESGVYELQDNEILYFALMYPHTKIEDAVILRGYTKESLDGNTFEIRLNPEDTYDLPVGVYYYTIKLQRGVDIEKEIGNFRAGEMMTIVPRTKFVLND